METEPKDIWTILKAGWTPQPRWLSSECVGPVSPSDHAPILLAPAQPSHQGEAPETASTLKIRNRKRKILTGNVVELRPRLRDEVHATELLKALCAACEAHAAGNNELMMVRIKMLYHMFDDGTG